MTTHHSVSRYASVRGGSGFWAQVPETIHAWVKGAMLVVRPVTLEFAPILDCNASCPGCPYARSRHEACDGRVHRGEFAQPNDLTVATRETARRVLEASAEAGVRGVLWTGGGEPTIWEPLPDVLRYSAQLGMVNCLYTNGVQLGLYSDLAEQLLAPEMRMIFVRVSVNAISPATVRRHWGVKDPQDIAPQLVGLDNLLKARKRGQRIPSVQVSTIVDGVNSDDLLPICQTVAQIVGPHKDCLGDEDVMIVRPLANHRTGLYSIHDHDEEVITRIIEVCGKKGLGHRLVGEAGMKLFLGFGLDRVESGEFRTYADVLRSEYKSRDYCWANGLFLTVGPDASVYLCTEHNCDPNWAIGNLKRQSVDEIYHSARRRELLEIVHGCRLGPSVFEPNTRASRLDRIAKAIQSGELTAEDIKKIREASLAEPSLLLS